MTGVVSFSQTAFASLPSTSTPLAAYSTLPTNPSTISQKTLLLDQGAWDLVLDANGDIAVAGAPYSIAQDVASAVRTFLGECWYDTTQGIPYWQQILGKYPPLPFVKQKITEVALTVPNVAKVDVFFTGFSGRTLTGQIQVIDTDGVAANVAFG